MYYRQSSMFYVLKEIAKLKKINSHRTWNDYDFVTDIMHKLRKFKIEIDADLK